MDNPDLAVELILSALSGGTLILVVLLPLAPAILIYKIFPKTSISASGSVGALTWNASGAFAAYMIVLAAIIVSPPLNQLTSAVGSFYSPTWTVELEVHGYDKDANPKKFSSVEVVLDPDIHRISTDKILLKIPGFKRSDWPIAYINVPGGSREINLASLKGNQIEVDNFRKHITVLTPMEIKQVPTSDEPYPPPGGDYLNQ